MLRRICSILLVALLLISGCAVKQVNNNEEEDFIKFFIPDRYAMYWLIEEKPIHNNDLKAIVNEVIKHKNSRIAEGTKLLSIEVKDRIANVNLSKEFNSYNLGSCGTLCSIYTIVNTLCLNESLGIDGVKFLIEGKSVKTIGECIGDNVIAANAKLLPTY